MKKFYTEEMKEYILSNCKGKTIQQLQIEFNNKFKTNITLYAMKSYLSNHKLKVGRGNKRKFNNEHIEFLRKNVKGITLKELTNKFNKEFKMNITESAVSNLKYKYNLQSGIFGGRFEKGQVSWNKGRKMSPSQYKKCRPTMFKKGNIPANRRPIGSERIDNNRDKNILIKIQDGHKQQNWMGKHRYIYEQAHGKIPAGHKVIFADGNNRNFDLDNLVLVSNAEELIMNNKKLFKQDKELTKLGATVAKVIDKTNKLRRKE